MALRVRADGDAGAMHLGEHLPAEWAQRSGDAVFDPDFGFEGRDDARAVGLGQRREQGPGRRERTPGDRRRVERR